MIRLLKYYLIFGLFCHAAFAQKIKPALNNFQPVGVYIAESTVQGSKAIRVVKDSTIILDDEATFAKLNDLKFSEGTIQIKVLSKIKEGAPDHARGFIGVAFHINENNSIFEAIYLRPANARVDDQLRRNRSIQYFAYPGFKFSESRKTVPGVYESYEDMELNKWIAIKIVVKGQQAKLFIDGRQQPSLVVNDLKLGEGASGSIGLFVDTGTEGYFKDLTIDKASD